MEFQLDHDRLQRTGVPEAIFCEHKSVAQIDAMLTAARAEGRRLLLTRLSAGQHAALGAAADLDYDARSGTAILGGTIEPVRPGAGIVVAGTSDMPVAREAARTLAFHGLEAPLIADVGVAGLWRLTSRLDEIRGWKVVIAVAGMEGALFSVVAGLVAAPVIAVPTAVGYGVARGGTAALHAALASCAPGVVVVNIDNGFGAAIAAIKMLNTAAR